MVECQFCGNEADADTSLECADCARALDDWPVSSMTTRAEFIRTAANMLCFSDSDMDQFAKNYPCDFRLGAAISARGLRGGDLVGLVSGEHKVASEVSIYVRDLELRDWIARNQSGDPQLGPAAR
jgi:hypothetical protein